MDMTAKLTPEQAQALHASGDNRLPVIDPTTNHVYVVVDQAKHEQAMQALQQLEVSNAIREGLADMEAGRSMPVEVARELTAKRLQTQYGNHQSQQ